MVGLSCDHTWVLGRVKGAGESKWKILGLFGYAVDGILSFSSVAVAGCLPSRGADFVGGIYLYGVGRREDFALG